MESSFEFTGSGLWLSCEGPWNLTYKSAQTPLAYDKANQPKPVVAPPPGGTGFILQESPPGPVPSGPTPPGPTPPVPANAKSFHGNVTINVTTAKMRLVEVAEEIIALLAADPNVDVKVSIEIQANFPNGAQDQTRRAVSENARTLGFKNADWE